MTHHFKFHITIARFCASVCEVSLRLSFHCSILVQTDIPPHRRRRMLLRAQHLPIVPARGATPPGTLLGLVGASWLTGKARPRALQRRTLILHGPWKGSFGRSGLHAGCQGLAQSSRLPNGRVSSPVVLYLRSHRGATCKVHALGNTPSSTRNHGTFFRAWFGVHRNTHRANALPKMLFKHSVLCQCLRFGSGHHAEAMTVLLLPFRSVGTSGFLPQTWPSFLVLRSVDPWTLALWGTADDYSRVRSSFIPSQNGIPVHAQAVWMGYGVEMGPWGQAMAGGGSIARCKAEDWETS